MAHQVPTFFHLTLRTTDVPAARQFYQAVLGPTPLDIVQLHEASIARGARPHWLGFLDVPDVDTAVAAFVSCGAAPLGPKWVNPQGLEAAVVRDPGGAVVALARPPPGFKAPRPEVCWHLLNATHLEEAKAAYAEVLGWHFEVPHFIEGHGTLHPFRWDAQGAAPGALMDVQGRPGVHPHWLFQLPVVDLDHALTRLHSNGGTVAATITLSDGTRMAVCDDPQGAAFALRHANEAD